MDNDILSHIIEIKTQMAAHEEADNALRADVRRVLNLHEQQGLRVNALEREASEVKASLKTVKWIIGLVVALGAGLAKLLKP